MAIVLLGEVRDHGGQHLPVDEGACARNLEIACRTLNIWWRVGDMGSDTFSQTNL